MQHQSADPPARKRVETLIAVISCHAYLATRLEAVRRTWLKKPLPKGVAVIFVVGRAPTPETKLQNDVAVLDCADDYESLPYKTMAMLRYAHSHYDFHTLIKIDDDVYVPDVERLLDACRNADYVGFNRFVSPDERRQSPHLPGSFMYGGIYALSGRVVAELVRVRKDTSIAFWRWEDVMIGRLIEDISLSQALNQKHDPRFVPLFRATFALACACLPRCAAVMHQSPRRLLWLYRLDQFARPILWLGYGAFFALASVLGLFSKRWAGRHPFEALVEKSNLSSQF